MKQFIDVWLKLLRRECGKELFRIYNQLQEGGRTPNLKTILQKGGLLKRLDIYNYLAYYPIDKAKKK
jgi:hypothetical protein